ncbi:MAG: IMP dehydrogenase [Candidatus Sericytochromatia bacterium]|nr:IMP dehydrogenase [Candidatus Sericytochromatia bacterium]
MREGLTYSDVLLVPQYSDIESRRNVSTHTRLSRRLKLHIPIVSANMDTVTESTMATRMAELGGIGIIHRFLTLAEQVREVAKVKRSHNFVIPDPYTIQHDSTLADVREAMYQRSVTSFLVVDQNNHLCGIVTPRDMMFEDGLDTPLSQMMTPFERLVYKEVGSYNEVDYEQARQLLKAHKLEKLPLINAERQIIGLITAKDIQKRLQYPQAIKDAQGRLLVGAAIGVKNDYLERTQELVKAGVDVLVIDIAHGHFKYLLETLSQIKSEFPQIDVIAGNVASAAGTRDLIAAGADAIKVGVGPGSTCSTRIVTGSGVPQLTAVMDCVEAAKGIPVIADGGVRYSGDMVKALAAGASSVMLGGLLGGCEESPGLTRIKDGQKVKVYRGMASYDAARNRQSAEKGYEVDLDSYVPEGIETVMPYKGKVHEVIGQLMGGLRSGMSYLGAHTLPEMVEKAEFVRISPAGWHESTPHAQYK